MKMYRWFVLFLLAVFCVGCQPAAATATDIADQSADDGAADVVLTVTGLDGTAKDFTLDELKALPSVEGQAGIKSSTGKITPPTLFKGVLLTDLLAQVGALDSTMGVEIQAADGYAMTYSVDQILNGDFIAYDPGTGDETKDAGQLQAVIAYEMDGQPLNTDSDGVLRLVIISEKNNQVTDGHWSIKWVRNITVKPLAEEWSLALEGGIVDSLDRGSFESCSTANCHATEWTDGKAQTWAGTPLWLVVGRMDDDIKHGDASFNRDLAGQGYTVEVIGTDGKSVTFDIARLVDNNNIIVANQVNGNPLNDSDFPLCLVGSDLQEGEALCGIEKIVLHLDVLPTVEAATEPATDAGVPVTLPEGKALLINGLVPTGLAWSMDELNAMDVVQLTVEHPKKGPQDVEGVRLNALLDLAQLQPEATQLLFTAVDGFTVTADLQAVRDCPDCLVAFTDSNCLKLAMPGMDSSLWVKDLIAITVQ